MWKRVVLTVDAVNNTHTKMIWWFLKSECDNSHDVLQNYTFFDTKSYFLDMSIRNVRNTFISEHISVVFYTCLLLTDYLKILFYISKIDLSSYANQNGIYSMIFKSHYCNFPSWNLEVVLFPSLTGWLSGLHFVTGNYHLIICKE